MTLAEWLKTQDKYNDPAVGIVEEAMKDIPEFNALDFRTVNGTSYKIYRRDKLPSGAFRSVGTGVSPSQSEGSQVSVECYFYDSLISVDEAQIMGDTAILGDEMTNEGAGLFEGNLQNLASQIYYGTGNDAGGFKGYAQLIPEGMISKAQDTASSFTSVYFVHTGRKGIQFIGGNSSALQLGDVYNQDIYDEDGKSYRAYCQRMRGWYGLQQASSRCVGKITNVNGTSGLTQAMMAAMLKKFPSNAIPNAIFMNREVFYDMWLPEKAKVGILKSGSTKLDIMADYNNVALDDFRGIPIYVSDAIKENEAA